MNTIMVRSKVTFRDKAKSDIVGDHEISFDDFEEFQLKIRELYPTYNHEYNWDETLTHITRENYNSERYFTFAFFTCMDLESIVNCTLRSYDGLHQESQDKSITHNSLSDLRNKVQNIYPGGSELRLFLLAESSAMPLDDVYYNTLSRNERIVAILLSTHPPARESTIQAKERDIKSRLPALERLSGRLDQLLKFA